MYFYKSGKKIRYEEEKENYHQQFVVRHATPKKKVKKVRFSKQNMFDGSGSGCKIGLLMLAVLGLGFGLFACITSKKTKPETVKQGFGFKFY